MGFSWKGAVNKVGDGIEHGVDKVKKKAGEIIDDGAHIVGDGLDHVGLDDAADWVEDKGDHIADDLGAHVAEQQLGQTDQPEELLHGDPAKIREAVLHLARLSLAFDTGHTGLAHLDPGDWDGAGAEAFRAKFTAQPAKWAHAATACAEAGLALETYAETVDWAKGQAKEAVRLWKQGVAARKTAADAYNAAVDTYHDDVKAYNDKVDDGTDPGAKPVAPAAFTDPGAKDRQAAKDTLDAARKQRDSAAATAEAKVRTATELAPKKPDFTGRMENDLGDVGRAAPIAVEHFAGGLVRSVTDLEKFVRGLNPTDPYNLTHPAQYLTHLNATAAGLVDMTAHPERLPGIILGTGWGSDGSEASGRLVGNILLAIATDGGSAAGKTVAEDAAKNAAKDAAEQAVKNGARAAAEDPAKSAIEQAAKKCLSDPIDVATGDMILTQTDLTLPGTLPLVLQRTHLSSYRIGRFYGPSWASALDQRLELDDQGVAFVADDGSILLYPVPQPGVPAFPSHGPRWPLEWDGTPGSPLRITKTEAGHTLHFTTVPGATATPGGPMPLPLTEVTDRNGNSYAITHDDDGVPIEIHHSGGYHLTLSSGNGRVTALRLLDPAAPDSPGTFVRAYAYDESGHLTAVTDSTAVPYRFTYDTAGRITSWTDRNDTSYHYTYDHRGRCVATRGTEGFLNSTFSYNGASRTTTYTNSLGHSSTYRHSAAYRLVCETDPLGNTTTQQWDPANRHLIATTDPLGHTTRYAYDEVGNLTELLLADGSVAHASYDSLHRPTAVVEPGGATWRHSFDERGNLLVATDPLGAETRHAYNASGHLLSTTDAVGHTRTFATDSAGLVVAITDEAGHRSVIRRDPFGHVVEVVDPLGLTTRTSWTPEGMVERREHADGSRESWTWDAEGNLTSHTDPAGNVTRHTTTHFDLPATRTDPDGVTYAFAYDSELQLVGVTNPQGLTWSYQYDEAGRLVTETDFNGRRLAYSYDASGNLTSRTNGVGDVLRFARDALGRVTEQRTDLDGTTYQYSVSGHLTGSVNRDAVVAVERDARGRVLAETVNGRTVTFSRDALGRVTCRTTPSGLTSLWTYDPTGRPSAIAAGTDSLTFAYDAAGRERERRFSESIGLTQSWDPVHRLTEQTIRRRGDGDDRLIHRTFAHRADGYLTEVSDLSSRTRRFGLDTMGRVTEVRAHGWSETYAYDAAGNVTHATAPAHEAAGERAVSGTLVRRAGHTTYVHDAQGRLIRKTRKLLSGQRRTWTYSWNAEDRLTEAVTPDGRRWRYAYDPLGRRISKHRLTEGGSAADRTDFTWDETRLIEQRAADGQVTTWDFTPGTHTPLAQRNRGPVGWSDNEPLRAVITHHSSTSRSTRFHAVVTDSVGTPTELVTPEGEVVWKRNPTHWGTSLPVEAEVTLVDCPLRFPGQYADSETGLNYNYARYYDPEIAKYISADPLGLEPADNHHAYVLNALNWSDPLGLNPKCGIDLSNATPHQGRFPKSANPDEILVRRKQDGSVTAYAVYGRDGLPVKRVDVDPDSAPHGGVPAPHVLETHKNVNPRTGQTFLTWDKMPRPARPDELPQ
ncbi:polymorphic toxin type 24 domain-containing protein [Streptomyces sp. NBC_00433]